MSSIREIRNGCHADISFHNRLTHTHTHIYIICIVCLFEWCMFVNVCIWYIKVHKAYKFGGGREVYMKRFSVRFLSGCEEGVGTGGRGVNGWRWENGYREENGWTREREILYVYKVSTSPLYNARFKTQFGLFEYYCTDIMYTDKWFQVYSFCVRYSVRVACTLFETHYSFYRILFWVSLRPPSVSHKLSIGFRFGNNNNYRRCQLQCIYYICRYSRLRNEYIRVRCHHRPP